MPPWPALPASSEYTPRSPQFHLIGRPVWRAKPLGCEWRRAAASEPVPAAAGLEPALEQLRPRPLPAHAVAEAGIVVAAAAKLANTVPDPLRPVGEMSLEPFIEEILDLARQPQQDITRRRRTGRR